jgi:hypothetical protein
MLDYMVISTLSNNFSILELTGRLQMLSTIPELPLLKNSKNTDIVMLLVEKGATLRSISSAGRDPGIGVLKIKKKQPAPLSSSYQ